MNSEKKGELREIVRGAREKLDKIVYEQNVATDERLNNLEGFLEDFNDALSSYLSE